jgi:hypothetical protein
MIGRFVPETKSCGLIPGAGVVSPCMHVVHEWYIMIRESEPPEVLTENVSIPYAAMS